MSDPRRCAAAHHEDRRECEGKPGAVWIVDRFGGRVAACVRHGAAMLASLEGALVLPGSVEGAATEVFKRAQRRQPFDFETDATSG